MYRFPGNLTLSSLTIRINYSINSDKELLNHLSKGDETAYVEIYDRYKTVLFLHARRMINDDEQARDIVQEIFTTLWLKKGELQISLSLKSYLFGAVKNKVLNLIVHQKHVEKHMQKTLDIYNKGSFCTDQTILERELSELIEKEIKALPPRMREVFILSRKEHLSNAEISERMEITPETVKKQIVYALKILRTKLKIHLIFIGIIYIVKNIF